MLDRDGFRPNVGIILLNQKNQVFCGKRIRTHSWQFPQGGIDRGESPEQAMYRELHEEVGLMPDHVRIVARTRDSRSGLGPFFASLSRSAIRNSASRAAGPGTVNRNGHVSLWFGA